MISVFQSDWTVMAELGPLLDSFSSEPSTPVMLDPPPPYSEVTKEPSLDPDTLDKRRDKKARRRVKNIKIGVACFVILLFLM